MWIGWMYKKFFFSLIFLSRGHCGDWIWNFFCIFLRHPVFFSRGEDIPLIWAYLNHSLNMIIRLRLLKIYIFVKNFLKKKTRYVLPVLLLAVIYQILCKCEKGNPSKRKWKLLLSSPHRQKKHTDITFKTSSL